MPSTSSHFPLPLEPLSQAMASLQERASASPEHQQQPPSKQYPSDKIRYNEKVGGRSTNITLNAKVAARLFEVQSSLKTLSSKPVSTPATVGWLLDHCAGDIADLKKRISEANAGGGARPGCTCKRW